MTFNSAHSNVKFIDKTNLCFTINHVLKTQRNTNVEPIAPKTYQCT